MKFELRHIRAFLCLAEELHFNRAAERLHTSQPALSRTIRDLEDAVGARLLLRTTRCVGLTDAGKAFLTEIQPGLRHIERAVEAAQHADAGITGELRIAYMDFAINGKVPELIRAFRTTQPGIRLLLSFIPTFQQKQALLENRIDLGFLIGHFDNPNIKNQAFDEENYVTLLPSRHPLASAKTVRLTDLADEPFVLGTGENWSTYRDRLFKICHQAGFSPMIVQEASSSEGIFGLVAAGTGVSIYAECVRNLQRRGLVIRNLDDLTDTIPVFAAWNALSVSPSLSRFVAFLQSDWQTHGHPWVDWPALSAQKNQNHTPS